VCRSWEGAQPGSQPELASGNTPYHRHRAQFMNGSWLRGQESSLFQECGLFCEFGEFCETLTFGETCRIHELRETHGFRDCCSGTGYAIGHRAVRKDVLCIAACFAYSLQLLLLALVFPLLSYETVLILTHSFTFFSFSSQSHWLGEERVSGCVVLVASCWVKLRHLPTR